MNQIIEQIEEYASKNNVPIMQKDGILFLLDFINKNKILNILEIGTAIGYSAIKMSSVNDNIKITTIERDEERYKIAKDNIEKIGLSSRIKVILSDALNVELDGMYDLIFIDAAKGKNIEFFEKYKGNLNDGGYIITDNLSFHGLVNEELLNIKSRNVRGLVRKIKKYIEYLKNNDEFETNFYEIGDGISVSRKR